MQQDTTPTYRPPLKRGIGSLISWKHYTSGNYTT